MNNPHDLDALVRMLEYPWKPEGPYRAAALAYGTFATVTPWEATRPERSVPRLYTGAGPTPRLARMRAMRACYLEHPHRTADGRPPAFSDAETLYYNAVLDQWVRDLFGDNAAITQTRTRRPVRVGTQVRPPSRCWWLVSTLQGHGDPYRGRDPHPFQPTGGA